LNFAVGACHLAIFTDRFFFRHCISRKNPYFETASREGSWWQNLTLSPSIFLNAVGPGTGVFISAHKGDTSRNGIAYGRGVGSIACEQR